MNTGIAEKSQAVPTTLTGIKRMAEDVKREQCIRRPQALDIVARLAGYDNYAHAQAVLGGPK